VFRNSDERRDEWRGSQYRKKHTGSSEYKKALLTSDGGSCCGSLVGSDVVQSERERYIETDRWIDR
jgi:hypothetical protein